MYFAHRNALYTIRMNGACECGVHVIIYFWQNCAANIRTKAPVARALVSQVTALYVIEATCKEKMCMHVHNSTYYITKSVCTNISVHIWQVNMKSSNKMRKCATGEHTHTNWERGWVSEWKIWAKIENYMENVIIIEWKKRELENRIYGEMNEQTIHK